MTYVAVGVREVSGEAVLLAGGAAAILLQVADPAVALGVARHSDFADRPLERLDATLTYLAVVVYGEPHEVGAIARSVGGAHRGVPGGRDAHLQLWVAATLYEVATRVRALVLGADSPADADAILAGYAVVGTALGMPAALWPTDRASFERYWTSRPLVVGDDARRIAADLLHPRTAPWWLRRLMPLVRLVTAGLLEERLRRDYGLEFDERRFDAVVRWTRRVYPRMPRALREWPVRHYLARYRREAVRANR